ncbi:U3 small nucleolar RNA-associated protein 14 homolog A [Chiloscyllium plagiosum]|uniref:U3 small nucleolar RNA-associated protein 14 homolog A n=1 Tax=Chiloscyllium plagiosum TaxID=36176 RepID=UPI001CB83E7C|nr:U3 small nucleolar RNA-associated protein 14 homolog A [Chiloscyllium plagiosum]
MVKEMEPVQGKGEGLCRDLLSLGMEEEDLLQTEHVLTASEDEDGSDDERRHQKLLEAISSLGGERKKKLAERTEASLQVSEFTVSSEGANEKIELSDLLRTIRPSLSSLSTVKKQLKTFEKTNKTLDLPLSKQQSEKIQRSLAYEKTSKEVTKWNHTVLQNRKAEQLVFPLNAEQLTVKPVEEMIAGWKARTPLEQEIFDLLHKNKQPVSVPALTAAEQASVRAMSLQEAKERRAELQKARVLQSYYEAKAKRSKKIKSKKFHRVMKKIKQKEILKQFEELKKTKPEEALEELNKMEQRRMEERMTLRHQNSGKWAKSKVIMAKYDTEARSAIRKQLELNKRLTTKVQAPSESEDEVEPEVNRDETVPDFVNDAEMNTVANPWMLGKLSANPKRFEARETEIVAPAKIDENEGSDEEENLSEDELLLQEFEKRRRIHKEGDGELAGSSVIVDESKDEESMRNNEDKERGAVPGDQSEKEQHLEDVNEFNHLFEKLLENKSDPMSRNPKKYQRKNKKMALEKSEEDVQTLEKPEEPILDEQLERKRTVEDLETLIQEECHDLNEASALDTPRISGDAVDSENKTNATTEGRMKQLINPKNVLNVTSKSIKMPLVPTAVEEENEEYEDQRMVIQEAFASDDVIDDFIKDKQKHVDASKPKDIDLTLPGWGEWGGQGLQPSAKKRKRFRIKAAPPPPRKDQHLPNVIINENRDIGVAAHQVNELPFPYSHQNQFEKSICVPIGSTWNTEKVMQKLTLPKVVTKMGTIIEPISEDDLLQEKKTMKSKVKQNPRKRRKMQNKSSH